MPKRDNETIEDQPPQNTMSLRLGNPAPKEGYKEAVPESTSRTELEALAQEVGAAHDADTPDELLRARINDSTRYRNLDDHRVTYVHFPPGTTLSEAFTTLTHSKGIWAAHAQADGDGYAKPTWVDGDNSSLVNLVAENYGAAVGAPDDLEVTHHTHSGPPGVGADGPIGGK